MRAIQNSNNCRRLEMATYFFLTREWDLQEQTKHLQYHNQWSTDTNVCGGFTLGVIVGRLTQAQSGKNALLQSFFYTTCRTTGRRRTDVVVYWLQNSTAFKLAPPGKRGSLGLEWLEGLLYQTPGTFSQQALLEALIVTRGSASYFGEQ